MEQVIDYVRTRPHAIELLTSWVPKPGGPEAFYLGLGFVPTGEVDEGEARRGDTLRFLRRQRR